MGRPRIRTDADVKRQACEARSRHREKRGLIVLEYLTGKVCTICGESDLLVLEFDHVRGEKKWDISEMVSRSMGTYKDLYKELEKCDVICRHCHVRKHHQERNTQKWRYVNALRHNISA